MTYLQLGDRVKNVVLRINVAFIIQDGKSADMTTLRSGGNFYEVQRIETKGHFKKYNNMAQAKEELPMPAWMEDLHNPKVTDDSPQTPWRPWAIGPTTKAEELICEKYAKLHKVVAESNNSSLVHMFLFPK